MLHRWKLEIHLTGIIGTLEPCTKVRSTGQKQTSVILMQTIRNAQGKIACVILKLYAFSELNLHFYGWGN